jgi:hypothetical protein
MRGKDPKLAKLPKPKIAVFGESGVGKTWGALDWPSCYFIDTEGGANLPHYTDKLKKVGALYVGPEDGAVDFDVICQEVFELVTTKHNRKTFILDSYSHAYNESIQKEYDSLKSKGQDPAGFFGKEKKPAIAATRKIMSWLHKLDMSCLLICHQKDVWKDKEVVGQTLDGWERLIYALNLVVQVTKQGNTRKAKVIKSRFQEFPQGDLFDWSYDVFRERFGYDTLESEPVALKLASKAQVKELTSLIEALNVGADVLDKWKEKAEVETWNEMDAATIQKCIDSLTSKLPKAPAVA